MRPQSVEKFHTMGRVLIGPAGFLALVTFINPRLSFAQSPASAAKFEVAAIRPTRPNVDCVGHELGWSPRISPRRFSLGCISAMQLVREAYGRFANGRLNPPESIPEVIGGPAWFRSGGYNIDATTEDAASRELMNGPMLQSLLEDRFKLKIHRETREVPVYALNVGKAGSKLRPFKEGGCVLFDFDRGFYELPPGGKFCDALIGGRPGFTITLEAQGASTALIGWLLGHYVDRPIVDRTGLAGMFDAHMEFLPEQTAGQALSLDPAGGASIFTAVREQLGLSLDPSKGPVEVLVIDQVERPSEN
jgi:uncharacterized protein (TIGR03435 family)